jgi:heme/copper-type cytochrome/quinol oxidase subunit 1
MTISALFLMGSIAIFLLGTFHGFLAQTLPVRLSGDTPVLAIARLHYLFTGITVFALGALAYLPERPDATRHETLSRLGFWLMIIGFNLAFFPTTLRRSQAFLSDPVRLFSSAVGPEVSLGAVMFVSGVALCLWTCAVFSRSIRS